MIQLTNLGFGVPTFSFSLPILWKILYQSFTTAYNSLEFTFETLVAWFKPFKQLKHCFCLVDLPNFQTTYQNLVSTHMLSSKSHTKRWKVQKSQPFQPQCFWNLWSMFICMQKCIEFHLYPLDNSPTVTALIDTL